MWDFYYVVLKTCVVFSANISVLSGHEIAWIRKIYDISEDGSVSKFRQMESLLGT